MRSDSTVKHEITPGVFRPVPKSEADEKSRFGSAPKDSCDALRNNGGSGVFRWGLRMVANFVLQNPICGFRRVDCEGAFEPMAPANFCAAARRKINAGDFRWTSIPVC